MLLLATSLAAAVLSHAAAAAADAADAPAPCSPAEYSLLPLDKAKGAPEGEHAACLDGSVPKMHYRPGKGADVRKVLVFLQGGGWCETSGQCYNRSVGAGGQSGDLGSSKNYPQCTPMVDGYEGGMGLREANSSISAWADWAEAYFHCKLPPKILSSLRQCGGVLQ
jgi:hypothetical protein